MKPNQPMAAALRALVDSDDTTRHAVETFSRLTQPPPESPLGPPGKGRFGVWEADESGDWRVRDDLTLREKNFWRLRSHAKRPKDPATRRVLLLGGSAAAAFGYWGDFSLAVAIEHRLNRDSPHPYEVVDLTCINALWKSCREIFHHGSSLMPDIAVFFCGNNEAKSLVPRLRSGELAHLPSARDALFLDELGGEDRVALLNRCYEEHMAHEARVTIQLAKTTGVPAVFVIPESNLRDWRGHENVPHDLAGDRLMLWWRLATEAAQALEIGDSTDALLKADQLLELDGGRCQRSRQLQAKALEALDRPSDALDAYRQARDAGLGPFIRATPQVTTGAIETLRRTYAHYGVDTVDLPKLLAPLDTNPCGREMFIDYCHLTADGIQTLAGAVAEKIAEGNQKPPSQGSSTTSPEPAPGDEISCRENALGAWVAAIHNYHYGQPIEMVAHWLGRALEQWPDLDDLLDFLSDNLCDPWRERFTIAWFKKHGFYDLLGDKQFFFFAKYFYHARFDVELVHAIDRIRGLDPERKIRTRLIEAGDVLADLGGELYSLFFMDMRTGLQSGDHSAPRGGWERPCLDIGAYAPESLIRFPLSRPMDSTIHLKALRPASPQGTPLNLSYEVVLNDTVIANPTFERGQSEISVEVPEAMLRPGLNELRLCWGALAGLTDCDGPFERRRYVTTHGFYPIAARIERLTLTTSSKRTSTDRPS